MNNLIGQTLGRYHILEQLGEGGMAVVYKAYDTRLERDVAVKVIRTERLTIETMAQTLKRFEREAKSLAKLTHPNIVPITDYGEHEGKPYLVMPHLPGGTLKQMLGKPMGWEETIRILLPVARALAFAHQQGIIHRDVKPSNILITSSGEPMLTDFGIAKILVDTDTTAELTGTGMGIGTPEYMAPEQWTGHVTPQTDIYALGVVFYEMVTGRKPYQADTPAALLLKQANDPLPRPRSFVTSLPDAVEKVLFKALAKGLEDRYQGMGEMVKAMEGLLAGKPVKEARPARRVKEETLTAVEFEPDEKTQVDEKPIVREKSTRRGWVWGVGAAGIVVLIFAITLVAKPGSFNLFPTAMATASLTPLPTLTITPSGTPHSTPTPTITPTPTLGPIPTFMVEPVKKPNNKISSSNISSLQEVAHWGLIDSHASQLIAVPHDIAFSNDGQIIAFSLWDFMERSIVVLKQVKTGETILTLSFPLTRVWSIKFLRNGQFATLLTTNPYHGGEVRIFDVNGNEIHRFYSSSDIFGPGLAVSDDGNYVAFGNTQINVWSIESEVQLAAVTGQYSNSNWVFEMVFSKDGKSVIAGESSGTINVWDIQTGNLIRVLSGHTGSVYDLDISPNGNYIVSVGNIYNHTTGAGDKSVRLWRISDGKQLCMFDADSYGFDDVSFTSDGSLFITIDQEYGGSGSIKIFNSSTCQMIKNFNGFDVDINLLRLSPDGLLLVTGEESGDINFFGVLP
jgi:serine/threonine protein kinase